MNKGSLLHILAESYNGNDPIGAIQKLSVPTDCYQNSVTPLMKAARVGNIKMIRALIQCGANPNALSNHNMTTFTALDFAISRMQKEAAHVLLDLGAHPGRHTSQPAYVPLFLYNRRRLRYICMTLMACRFRPTCPFDRNVLDIIARMIWDCRFE
jgi:ankyrin repeat protein